MRRLLIGLIRGYQYLLSPLIGPHCRFFPSCSHYAAEAIERHGVVARRISGGTAAGALPPVAPWWGRSGSGGHPGLRDMDNRRLILFFALAAVLLLIYQSWVQDYGQASHATLEQCRVEADRRRPCRGRGRSSGRDDSHPGDTRLRRCVGFCRHRGYQRTRPSH